MRRAGAACEITARRTPTLPGRSPQSQALGSEAVREGQPCASDQRNPWLHSEMHQADASPKDVPRAVLQIVPVHSPNRGFQVATKGGFARRTETNPARPLEREISD